VRDKANRALEKQGKSLILTPDSTLEPESSPSAEVEVDYSALPTPTRRGPEASRRTSGELAPSPRRRPRAKIRVRRSRLRGRPCSRLRGPSSRLHRRSLRRA